MIRRMKKNKRNHSRAFDAQDRFANAETGKKTE
jgi:hypothetical protein